MFTRAGVLLLGLGFAGAVFAGDVWRDKPYTQWEEKDIRKILMDSPWVKGVQVNASWDSDSARLDPGARDPRKPIGGGYEMSSGAGAPAEIASGNAPPPVNLGKEQARMVQYVVRWISARTIRQALARSQMLQGALTAASAEKILQEDQPEYSISIVGQDMTPFLHLEEKDLLAKTYLVAKKDKTKLSPSRVMIQRKPGADIKSGDPQSVQLVVFSFAKKNSNGEPVLGHEEKGAEFVCEVKKATIRAAFELQKMSAANGPDW